MTDSLDTNKTVSKRKIDNTYHADLVKKAARWLNKFGCGVVLSELSAFTHSGEIPDVIGWKNNQSLLIECKTSLTDFKKDQRKPFRHNNTKNIYALGHWRFYFAPTCIIPFDLIPDGWGLLELDGTRVEHSFNIPKGNIWPKPPFESCRDSEVALLVSKLRRLGIR